MACRGKRETVSSTARPGIGEPRQYEAARAAWACDRWLARPAGRSFVRPTAYVNSAFCTYGIEQARP